MVQADLGPVQQFRVMQIKTYRSVADTCETVLFNGLLIIDVQINPFPKLQMQFDSFVFQAISPKQR